MAEPASIRFLLNDRIETAVASPGTLALDYVRKASCLTGTKEGCKEGDCGACTVIVGELKGDRVLYKPVTSCLLPLADLAGKHLVTIEGLNLRELSPIQAAMVDKGGTQCGFCTPGFIVAMTAWLLDETKPLTMDGLKYAISGNLCRCTGYRPIKDAGMEVAGDLATKLESGDRVRQLCALGVIPAHFADAPAQLQLLRDEMARGSVETAASAVDSTVLVAGGTDLYVQRGAELPEKTIRFLNREYDGSGASLVDGWIEVDARMTFEAFATDPLVLQALPAMKHYNLLVASWPVRTRATLGGNIGNASPIADLTCLLLALQSELVLRVNDTSRVLPLKELFLGYKTLALKPGEWIGMIRFPKPTHQTRINWEKVSKRAWLDIATVNSAISLTMDGNTIVDAHLAVGGVAATPLYLLEASAWLVGKTVSMETVSALLAVANGEYSPISDVRGSAEYKRLLARQLIAAHFATLFPEICNEEALDAALR